MADVRARLQYEDQGWKLIGDWVSGDHLEGLDLEEVQMIAEKLAPRVASGSLFKRAVDVHVGWSLGRGMFVSGTERPKGAGKTPGPRKFFTRPANQEAIFSTSAYTELQKGRFIEGNVLVACNTEKKTVHRIPFNQITGVKVDPDFPENVIAYKRTWDTRDGTQNSVKSEWIYTRRFDGRRQASFSDGAGKMVPVAKNLTIVDLRANRQPGHVLGVPDGLAGMHWAEAYAETLRNGMVVVESLARILFRVTNKTKQGVQSTGVKIANSGGVMGGTASMAEGQELTAVSTAGRSYAFSENRPIAAMAAAAWNVSLPDLLADVSASGSSYGSAQAIQPSLRNAMLIMQQEWADFYKDIFETMGFERPTIVFPPFEAPDKYRELQAITLGSVALTDEEYRMSVLAALDIVGDSSDIPEALKLRNEPQQTAAQQASPDQGVSNSTGGGGQGANDQRSDGIGESLRREMAMSEIVDRFEELVNRAELAANA